MLKLMQGSFLEGNGVIVCDKETDKIYHLIVHKEKETNKLFIEIGERKYYKNEVVI